MYKNILKNSYFRSNNYFLKFNSDLLDINNSKASLSKNYLVFNSNNLENYYYLNKSKKKF